MISARIPNTCASLMKLGPSDAIVCVSLRARSRCVSSETNRGGPARIHRRLSRRNEIRNGASRYQTTKILRIMRFTVEPPLQFQFTDRLFEQREVTVSDWKPTILR